MQELPVEDAVYQQVPIVRHFILRGHEQRWNYEHTTQDAPRAYRTDFLCWTSRQPRQLGPRMQTRRSGPLTRSLLYIRPSIDHHGPNISREVDERTDVQAYFSRVQLDVLTRNKDNGGAFAVPFACRDAPQLQSWSYRGVLCPAEKLVRRCKRFRSVKVYAFKELQNFGERRFGLPNTRGAHVTRDNFFHYFYKTYVTLVHK